MTDGPAIQFTDVTKTFTTAHALDGLNLEVSRGSIFGFLGPNGAGKTSAMRILVGLSRPTSGTATVLGYDTSAESLEVRQRVGYLAQLPRFYDELSTRDTLAFARRFFPRVSEADVVRDVDAAIDLVGLGNKADDPVGSLSGGQRQRLGIAQAAVHQPELLILDEPASALDPIGRRDVLEIMQQLRGSTTIFYSTHILSDVERVSDTGAVIDHGRFVAQGPIGDVLAGPGQQRFVIDLAGDTAPVIERITAQPWAVSVATSAHPAVHDRDPLTRLHVEVNDVDEASSQLLRTILSVDDITVVSYSSKPGGLEDAFIRLVQPASTGRT